jgi:hypothetical protein
MNGPFEVQVAESDGVTQTETYLSLSRQRPRHSLHFRNVTQTVVNWTIVKAHASYYHLGVVVEGIPTSIGYPME